MNKIIYTNLYEKRLLKNADEINIFEENLDELASNFKEEDILELCQILDDSTTDFEVMFGVIHLLESLSSEAAFLKTIEGVVKLKKHSPEWAKTVMYRCLNDSFSIDMINTIFPSLNEEIKDGFYKLLSEIKIEDEENFGDAIKKICF